MNKIAVYPGTFDPVTLGHIDVIKRASILYDKLYVSIAHSAEKKPLFTVEERFEMLTEAVKDQENVVVEVFEGLVVDHAIARSARVVIRGLRMISDFEYEFQMALTNRKLNPGVETIFMMPSESYSYLSSRLIKEVALLGADVDSFIPVNVQEKLKGKLSK